MITIPTHISQIIGSDGQPLNEMARLDALLGGGIAVPDKCVEEWRQRNKRWPLILLISGGPGVGKTTLALELAYRWAVNGVTLPSKTTLPIHTLYVSSEARGDILLAERVNACGWESSRFRLCEPGVGDTSIQVAGIPANNGCVVICGREVNDIRATALSAPSRSLPNLTSPSTSFFTDTLSFWGDILLAQPDGAPAVPPLGLLVLDSLNIISDALVQGSALFEAIKPHESAPLVLAVVLDTPSNPNGHAHWQYAADIIFEIDRIDVAPSSAAPPYTLGSFRIRKARWQDHALGLHQVKLFNKPKENDPQYPPRRGSRNRTVRPLLPYLQEGGFFVFQSPHRYLSERAGSRPEGVSEQVVYESTTLPSLDRLITSGAQGGFPTQHCTALAGVRGGMKSHLAYQWLLANTSPNEKSLLVSLRDDEASAIARLRDIAPSDSFEGQSSRGSEQSNGLRVVYFRPGYIAPEDFLFRLWFHLTELQPKRVVINAFEQLESMFPLCAAQPTFVTTIVDMLWAERITSVIIAAGPDASSGSAYGLLPVSDLVLDFQKQELPRAYLEAGGILDRKYDGSPPETCREVVVEVARVPRGTPSGARGVLYMYGSENTLACDALP